MSDFKSLCSKSTCKKITFLKNSVKKIEYFAFVKCNSLEEIEIPKLVLIISKPTFSNYSSLKVQIHESIADIRSQAFIGCVTLKKHKFTEDCKKIHCKVFSLCSSLQKINIPNSVLTISSFAFENCTFLKKIKIPENITLIDVSFQECDSLKEIKVDLNNKKYCDDGSILFNKDKTILIKFPTSKHIFYYIPKTVRAIEENTFNECEFIKEITQANKRYANGRLKIYWL